MVAEYLTESGLRWLMIDIANTYGYDKATFNEQVAWVNDINESLERFEHLAESPYEYRKAVEALRTHQRGEKVSHMAYVDCSNQALQLYATLTSDLSTAYICNLSSGDVRTDGYGMLADQMNVELGTNIFTRKNCKKAMMTTLYGKRNAETVIYEAMSQDEILLMTEQGITIESMEIAFANAMVKLAPKAMQSMDLIQKLNDENIETYYWTMPDGFNVKYDVKRDIIYEGNRVSKEGVSFNFATETSIYGATKYNAGMAPNVIHSVDGYVAREMVRKSTEFITTIHDAFGKHVNHIDKFIEHYKDTMIELLNSNLLESIMNEIANGRNYILPEKSGTLTESHIKEAQYAVA